MTIKVSDKSVWIIDYNPILEGLLIISFWDGVNNWLNNPCQIFNTVKTFSFSSFMIWRNKEKTTRRMVWTIWNIGKKGRHLFHRQSFHRQYTSPTVISRDTLFIALIIGFRWNLCRWNVLSVKWLSMKWTGPLHIGYILLCVKSSDSFYIIVVWRVG